MRSLLALLLGFLPALGWLWWFRRRDRYEAEPIGQIAKFFGLGALITIPAGIANGLAGGVLGDAHQVAVAAAPIVEEACKFLLVFLLLRGLAECDEPIDGAMYAISAALGFAALENVAYVIRHGEQVMIGRSLFSTVGHGLFAVPWGSALGLQICGMGRPLLTVAGLVLGMVLHAIFNFLVGMGEAWAIVTFLLLAFPSFFLLAHRLLRHSQHLSPFAEAPLCGRCGEPVVSRHCGQCGETAPTYWRCARCGTHSPAEARFCGNCGRQRTKPALLPQPVAAGQT
jgi:RsiW-degrading membrane proteinase PrsW (M82 family)